VHAERADNREGAVTHERAEQKKSTIEDERAESEKGTAGAERDRLVTPEWEAANAAIEVALAADRRASAGTEVRIAMLKQARVLEEQGHMEEAKLVLDRVKEMQRQEGIV
jgi:hypothetical protein